MPPTVAKAWTEAEMRTFRQLIDERRSVGEIAFRLGGTVAELEALARALDVPLPEIYEAEFLLRSRSVSPRA